LLIFSSTSAAIARRSSSGFPTAASTSAQTRFMMTARGSIVA
jgi:hypothetical protein